MYKDRDKVYAEIMETLRGLSYVDLLRVSIYATALQPADEGAAQ